VRGIPAAVTCSGRAEVPRSTGMACVAAQVYCLMRMPTSIVRLPCLGAVELFGQAHPPSLVVFKSFGDSLCAAAPTWAFSTPACNVIQDHPACIPRAADVAACCACCCQEPG